MTKIKIFTARVKSTLLAGLELHHSQNPGIHQQVSSYHMQNMQTESSYADELYLRCAATPKLIVNYEKKAQLSLKGRITENILTIAFLRANNTNRTIHFLVELLWKLHYTNVLFVYDKSEEISTITTLFQLCWRNGFVNVLALVNQTLYTYQPFPRIKVVALRKLSEYYDKTHLKNFQGYALRSSISNNAPRVYHYTDDKGNLANAGYLYRLILLFAQHYNGRFEEVRMPTYQMNLTNIIKAFERKEIDILADLLFMYPNYSHSAVICNYRTFMMAPYAAPLPLYMYILKPLTSLLWLLIMLALCYAILAQMLLSWLRGRRVNFGLAFLRSLSSVLYLPSYYYSRCTCAQRFCVLLLLACSFLLTSLYQTSMASMFISRLYEPQVNSIADIARTKFLLPMAKEDIAYMSRLSGIPQIIYDRLLEVSPSEDYQLLRDLNTSYILTYIEDKVNFFMYQQKFLRIPRFKLIAEELTQVPLFISLPHGSPFLQLFDRYLGNVFDSGIFQKMFIDSAEEGILSNEIRFFRTVSIIFQPLKVEHFSLIFVVWAFAAPAPAAEAEAAAATNESAYAGNFYCINSSSEPLIWINISP
ncbi:uncharacterized protein LOC105230118 [Bactrocera dorsalis]|uniref:Uncharacterized protein LOC105230118 n=1 Tax=Bactrocera dorsalis TaxID=27457 RepID=A0ABM3JWY6_BACDO|nr:uncharacterized protein LOC105230118 [Bactrocera dorsalis]